ncbi:MAG: RNA polymerase sigma factor [Chthoniobacterales bacterium]|nr:RNA polymerase sigma factor [Chthoniobacterales bacterium]
MTTSIDDHEEPDDWLLVSRARSGDEDAFAELIGRHQGSIFAFIVRHVDDAETARDLAQETFIRAWFALERTRPQAKFSTWLFQIALNLCRDHARSRWARQSRTSESLVRREGEYSGEEREFPHPGPTPDHQAEATEALHALDHELAKLPTDLREAFIFGAIEGRPHKEIAELLKISPKAVEVRIYRARKVLIERLSALGIVAP